MTRPITRLLPALVLAAALDLPAAPPTGAQTPDDRDAAARPTVPGAVAASPATPDEPAVSSRWRYNPRGRTETAIEHQNEGELAAAGEAFGTALELAPADPVLQFNAGTAGVLGAAGAADPEASQRAVELLRAAAESAPAGLRPLAYYNLGNAHFAGQRYDRAIESYKEALRLDPANADAKHNLELAQRRLEEQQQEQESSEDQEENQDQQEQDQQREEREQEQDRQQDEQQSQPSPDESQQREQEQQQSPLPDFEEQPDMTAEQAAAILEAVENLEREQRRKQAMEQLKRAKGDRDW